MSKWWHNRPFWSNYSLKSGWFYFWYFHHIGNGRLSQPNCTVGFSISFGIIWQIQYCNSLCIQKICVLYIVYILHSAEIECIAVSGMCQWEVLWCHQSALWRFRLRSVGMLTFPNSNLKTSPYHYPHNLVLFSSSYTVSCIYCEFFNLSCFGWPAVFDLQMFSSFVGFSIDDITRFFTLAGNVLQHIW